jgi:hypothetical protein
MQVIIHQNVVLHGITLAENSTISGLNLENLETMLTVLDNSEIIEKDNNPTISTDSDNS